jgi:regulator of replication initiation timing
MLADYSLFWLCRLLRNRVSAQQARERKKQYISDLEDQMKGKDKQIEALNAKVHEVTEENKALAADNKTLRRLIVTMRGTSQPAPKPAPGASASRMGRPLRQEASQGNAMPNIHPQQVPEQFSSDSRGEKVHI